MASAQAGERRVARDGLRVLYVCRAVDPASPFTAAQVRWVSTLAAHPKVAMVHVLAPRIGEVDLPANVSLRRFAKRPWPRLVASFLWQVVRSRPRAFDLFFVAQGGPYPVLLLPFKLVARRPIYQWKAMPHVSRRMRFYAKWCDDLVFTATEGSLQLDLPNKRVVGHGIDAELFTPSSEHPDRDFVTIGRISPIKHIDDMVRALAAYREEYATTPSLDIIGRIGINNTHVDELRALVADLGLEGSVRFLGHVEYHELPRLLPRYRASLNFSSTALDKAVGESMACGVPVLTTNPCVAEIMSADLRADLVIPDERPAQVQALHRALTWDPDVRSLIGEQLRATIVTRHGLTTLFDRIIAETEATPPRDLALGTTRDGGA